MGGYPEVEHLPAPPVLVVVVPALPERRPDVRVAPDRAEDPPAPAAALRRAYPHDRFTPAGEGGQAGAPAPPSTSSTVRAQTRLPSNTTTISCTGAAPAAASSSA